MYAVEKLSSYITRGVYTVSGPFHPFGGAVDIIVVQQQDGSFKSSPWYVRFGKFQGVLKAREKAVAICVNGVDTGFHMYLDHKGEAYFLRECESEEGVAFEMSPPSSGDEMSVNVAAARFKKAHSCNYDADRAEPIASLENGNGKIMMRSTSRRSRIFGLMFGSKSMKETDQGANVEMVSSLERAEIAADLLETKWSTNLPPSGRRSDNPMETNDFDPMEKSDFDVTISEKEMVNTFEEGTNDNIGTKAVSEEHFEEVEVHNSSIVAPNYVGDDPNCCLSSDDSVKESDGSHDENLVDGRLSNMPREVRLQGSTIGVDVSIQPHDISNLFSGAGGTLQEHICEGTSRPESEKATNRENYGKCHTQDLESFRAEESFSFQDLQARNPSIAVSLQDTSSNDSNSDYQKSSFSESQTISQDRDIIELPDGKVSRIEAVNFIENHCLVIEDASVPDCHVPEHNDISIISNEGQEFQSIGDVGSGDKHCLQNKLTIAQDGSRFQIAESLEDEQFQFSDIDSFSVKQINLKVQVNNAAAEMDDTMLFSTEGDIKEHISEDTNQDECFDNVSEVSGSQTSRIAIPKRTLQLGETGHFAKSLPIVRSQIHDIDRSNLLHPLSCSLDLNPDYYDEGLLEKETSSRAKLEPDPGNDMIQDNHTPQAASKAVDSDNNEGHNVIPINSDVDMPLCKHLLFEGMGADAASRVFEANKEQMPEPQGMIAVDQNEKNDDPSRATIPSGGNWRLWPFTLKKSRTISTVRSLHESTTLDNVDVTPPRSQSLMGHDDIQKTELTKKKVRSLTPTSEELASLNLKQGRNMVTFSFSTAMLGQQQVDARIYLWKWDTRVVISDVDGTITKSDVLGQFMPLVGKDWSQTGVAHLFSAIKENGYQWLFLSARAISQAYLTRQFLFNLKQDGKALPDGPVVISPDGLFPSLYREVIRRAPHEFKISCLEGIRALFPRECSPFYAGFGNRDTDEISYLKVGVPKGKIFIINPKGEVAVNRRVDTKSYTSLHAQVNGMFPHMSTTEQEDFNSWNYWKLPLPDIDI